MSLEFNEYYIDSLHQTFDFMTHIWIFKASARIFDIQLILDKSNGCSKFLRNNFVKSSTSLTTLREVYANITNPDQSNIQLIFWIYQTYITIWFYASGLLDFDRFNLHISILSTSSNTTFPRVIRNRYYRQLKANMTKEM